MARSLLCARLEDGVPDRTDRPSCRTRVDVLRKYGNECSAAPEFNQARDVGAS